MTLPGEPDLLKSGEKLGRYIILERLGTGGMGAVYSAYDTQLDRKVALKLLGTRSSEAEASQGGLRLLREAQAIARISHPNVVTVFDVGREKSRVFVAMEFVDGGTLRQWLRERTRSWKEILEVYRAAAVGLAAAHEAGIVHRDFKPDNVLLGKDGRVRVSDFGLARLSGPKGKDEPDTIHKGNLSQDASKTLSSLSSTLTEHGTIVGTAAYMAPEQFRGAPPESRSDQFAFCVSFYEALYGQRPYDSKQLAKDLTSVALPPPPSEAGVPGWIHKVLARGLSLDPQRRFASMNEIIRLLHAIPRTRQRAAAAAAVLLLVSGIAWPWYRFEQRQRLVCQGAEHKLASVWGEHQKQAIAADFLATGLPQAAQTVEKLSHRLDEYAHRWAAMEREACEATSLRKEQSEELLDLRMSCLSQRREEFKALAEILATADREVFSKALAAVQGLSPIEDCANVEVLKAVVKPPADAATRARVDSLRLRLSHIKALIESGKFADALPLAWQVATETENVPYRPLEAESLFVLGDTLSVNGKYDESERPLVRATMAAEASRHDEIAARAAGRLTWVLQHRTRYSEAETWAQLAFAAVERMGGHDLLLVEPLDALGAGYFVREKYAEALDYHRRALAAAERAKDQRAIASVGNDIGNVLRQQGQYDEALSYYERSLRIKEQLLGPAHPDIASLLSNVGNLMQATGQYDDALAYFQRSLEKREQSLGPSHPLLGTNYGAIGQIFNLKGQHDEALQWYQRALDFRERALGPNHPNVADQLVGIANAHLGLGQPERAIPSIRRALDIYGLQELGPTRLAEANFVYARALVALKRDPRQAKALAEKAREAFKKSVTSARQLRDVERWLAANFSK